MMNSAKTIAVMHEDGTDVIRIEKETSDGKMFYEYVPMAAWTDARQLVIAANKKYRLQF